MPYRLWQIFMYDITTSKTETHDTPTDDLPHLKTSYPDVYLSLMFKKVLMLIY